MLYKQLKRYNNFSVLKGDAEALVEFITVHAFFKTPLHKLKEKKLIEDKNLDIKNICNINIAYVIFVCCGQRRRGLVLGWVK